MMTSTHKKIVVQYITILPVFGASWLRKASIGAYHTSRTIAADANSGITCWLTHGLNSWRAKNALFCHWFALNCSWKFWLGAESTQALLPPGAALLIQVWLSLSLSTSVSACLTWFHCWHKPNFFYLRNTITPVQRANDLATPTVIN